MATFDINHVRSHFPALQGKQIYFDNAGGSQTLQGVIDAITRYLSASNVQLGATYPVSQESTRLYTAGCAAVARYIRAPSPACVVLGASTTQLVRNLSLALYEHLSPDSEIVISLLDHEANIAAWVQLAAWRGCAIKWWAPSGSSAAEEEKGGTTNPRLDVHSLRPLLGSKTRLVACTHTSNVLGTIHDVRAIAAAVHEVPGALLCVDAVAYAPHREIDVAAWGVDFYTFSWYKLYAGHIASMYASESAQKYLRTLGHFFKGDVSLEDKLGLAGASYELVASIPEVCTYLEQLPWDVVSQYEEKLQGILIDYLNSKPDVFQIYGEPTADRTKRVPVISFTVKGKKSQDVVDAVEARSTYGFRSGSFYSNRLVEKVLGLDPVQGVVRVSMLHYNTEEEIQGFVQTLDEVIRSN